MSARAAGCRPRGAVFGIALSTTWLIIKAFLNAELGWTLPLVVVLLILALLLSVLTLISPIAPFVYPLF